MRASRGVMVDKPDDMFNRDVEWMGLAAFATDERPGATLGIVSGRRRQGKTSPAPRIVRNDRWLLLRRRRGDR